MSRIDGGAKDEEAHTASMGDESDKASADFGRNPDGVRSVVRAGGGADAGGVPADAAKRNQRGQRRKFLNSDNFYADAFG